MPNPVHKGRVLGVSKDFSAPSGLVSAIAGINIVLAGEMASRGLECRLGVKPGTPLATRQFRHHNLMEWTLQNLEHILGALVTIQQQKVTQTDRIKTAGRFPIWESVVAAPLLKVSGVENPFDDWLAATLLHKSPEGIHVANPRW